MAKIVALEGAAPPYVKIIRDLVEIQSESMFCQKHALKKQKISLGDFPNFIANMEPH